MKSSILLILVSVVAFAEDKPKPDAAARDREYERTRGPGTPNEKCPCMVWDCEVGKPCVCYEPVWRECADGPYKKK